MRIQNRRVVHIALLYICCLITLSACALPGQSQTSQPASTPTSTSCSQGKVQTYGQNRPNAQGDWLLFHGSAQRDGAAVDGPGKLTPAWTYCTGAAIFASPIVHNGIVYVASTNMTLTALNIKSATMLWQMKADAPFYSTPAIDGNMIYAGSQEGTIYALDANTGATHWTYHVDVTGAKIWSSPVVTNHLLIVGLASNLNEKPEIAGQVIALDTTTGKLRWRTYTQANHAPGGAAWSSPAIDQTQHTVYSGTGDPDDGALAMNLMDGKPLWHWRSVTRDVGDEDVGSGPAFYNDAQGHPHVILGGKNGSLYNLDATNGKELWKTPLGNSFYGTAAYANNAIYAVNSHAGHAICWALNATTGQIRWHRDIPETVYSSPVVSGKTLYLSVGDSFGSNPGGVEVIDAENGQLIQNVDLHSSVTASPAVLASWVFVGTGDGNLYAMTR